MTYALGIDLGTTYTAAAVARDGRAEVAALGYRATSVPTVVLLTADGRFLVGDAAERRAAHEPERVAREFKRRVGDPTPLLLGGTPVAVDRCLAEVLRWVVTTVGEAEGGPPAVVTVTHPANWGEFKRDVLREALRLVDVPHPRLLPEPVAAATWYAQAERLAPGRTVAVYDLGGGTFDAAVLRRRPDGQFEPLGQPEGIERLGGVDVDEAVLGHVLRTVRENDPAALASDPDDPALRAATAQLRRACVEAKEALSSETSVTIPVWLPGVDADSAQQVGRNRHRGYVQILLNRSELEELIDPLLRPTTEALARVVASAGLQPGDLDAVLLVGGSSRIPLIAQQVSAGFRRPIAVDAHPKHPVALGAALDAAAHLAAVAAPPSTPPGVPAPPAPPASPPGPNGPGAYAAAGSVSGDRLASAAAGASASHPSWGPTPPVGPVPPAAGPTHVPPRVGRDDEASGRRLLVAAWLGTPTLIMFVMGLFFILSRNSDPEDDRTTTGTTAKTETVEGAGSGAPGETPEVTTAAAVNLLSDPSPALSAFAAIYDTPPRVRELTLWPDDASIEVQVPTDPTYVDSYRWDEGEVTGPEPVHLMDMEVEELEAKLFDLAEVNAAVIPTVVQQTLQGCTGEGFELSLVTIERDIDFDDQQRVLIDVFVSHPERGGGGYLSYTLDGTFVADHCS